VTAASAQLMRQFSPLVFGHGALKRKAPAASIGREAGAGYFAFASQDLALRLALSQVC
jgi:hypothetical protein